MAKAGGGDPASRKTKRPKRGKLPAGAAAEAAGSSMESSGGVHDGDGKGIGSGEQPLDLAVPLKALREERKDFLESIRSAATGSGRGQGGGSGGGGTTARSRASDDDSESENGALRARLAVDSGREAFLEVVKEAGFDPGEVVEGGEDEPSSGGGLRSIADVVASAKKEKQKRRAVARRKRLAGAALALAMRPARLGLEQASNEEIHARGSRLKGRLEGLAAVAMGRAAALSRSESGWHCALGFLSRFGRRAGRMAQRVLELEQALRGAKQEANKAREEADRALAGHTVDALDELLKRGAEQRAQTERERRGVKMVTESMQTGFTVGELKLIEKIQRKFRRMRRGAVAVPETPKAIPNPERVRRQSLFSDAGDGVVEAEEPEQEGGADNKSVEGGALEERAVDRVEEENAAELPQQQGDTSDKPDRSSPPVPAAPHQVSEQPPVPVEPPSRDSAAWRMEPQDRESIRDGASSAAREQQPGEHNKSGTSESDRIDAAVAREQAREQLASQASKRRIRGNRPGTGDGRVSRGNGGAAAAGEGRGQKPRPASSRPAPPPRPLTGGGNSPLQAASPAARAGMGGPQGGQSGDDVDPELEDRIRPTSRESGASLFGHQQVLLEASNSEFDSPSPLDDRRGNSTGEQASPGEQPRWRGDPKEDPAIG